MGFAKFLRVVNIILGIIGMLTGIIYLQNGPFVGLLMGLICTVPFFVNSYLFGLLIKIDARIEELEDLEDRAADFEKRIKALETQTISLEKKIKAITPPPKNKLSPSKDDNKRICKRKRNGFPFLFFAPRFSFIPTRIKSLSFSMLKKLFVVRS